MQQLLTRLAFLTLELLVLHPSVHKSLLFLFHFHFEGEQTGRK